jgi:hypothetical protein
LRKLVVQRFVQEHAEKIREGWGKDYEDMKQWCKASKGIPGSRFHGANDNTFNHEWYTSKAPRGQAG